MAVSDLNPDGQYELFEDIITKAQTVSYDNSWELWESSDIDREGWL